MRSALHIAINDSNSRPSAPSHGGLPGAIECCILVISVTGAVRPRTQLDQSKLDEHDGQCQSSQGPEILRYGYGGHLSILTRSGLGPPQANFCIAESLVHIASRNKGRRATR
jgi:hypothetical protein